MKKKKLLLLGGSAYILPVIREAHRLGLYVITCDYLPENVAHRYSDEYRNISIINKDAVLAAAREMEIDGVMSFACDPGVVTAAYVAEKLGLPFAGSYESVSILQDKGRFRDFLRENGFNTPWSGSYGSWEEAKADSGRFTYPAIVKPVDSAGSKGVRRIDAPGELEDAVSHALNYSHGGRVIVEEFLEKQGASSDCDAFSADGKLCCCAFDDQLFDEAAENPYTPAAYCWPSTMPERAQAELRREVQRLITLLGLKSSVYNIETRLCTNGKPYIMELSPRGGGNRLSEMLSMNAGVDLIRNAVKAAVGLPVEELSDPVYDGFWTELILHCARDGVYRGVRIADEMKKYVKSCDMWVEPGEKVERFTGANKAIGTLAAQFPDRDSMEKAVKDTDWIEILTD